MIRLTRERSANVVHNNFTGDRKEAFERELLCHQREIRRGDRQKHAFKSHVWKTSKDQLKIETGGKCAYCEAPTALVAYGDVEHYRPKSVYWWLAYSYENYLLSCTLCNRKYKDTKFPTMNRKMPGPHIRHNTTDAFIAQKAGKIAPDPLDDNAVQAFMQQHQQERPLLLNPYFDDPANFFAWEANDVLREVDLIPLPTNSRTSAFVNAAVKHFGLNRQELKNARYWFYNIFKTFKESLNGPSVRATTREDAAQRIEEMKSDKAPFAGMIRYFDTIL